MKKIILKIITFVIVMFFLCLFVGLIWGVYKAGGYFFEFFIALDNEVAVAIVAACGTILGAVATVVYSQNRSRKREIDESHRLKKAEIYDKFMKMLVQQLKNAKENNSDSELNQKTVDQMMDFKRDIIVWGAADVIRACDNFENISVDKEAVNDIMFRVDGLLRAFRKDLGNSNRKLKKGDLCAMFLNADARKELGL